MRRIADIWAAGAADSSCIGSRIAGPAARRTVNRAGPGAQALQRQAYACLGRGGLGVVAPRLRVRVLHRVVTFQPLGRVPRAGRAGLPRHRRRPARSVPGRSALPRLTAPASWTSRKDRGGRTVIGWNAGASPRAGATDGTVVKVTACDAACPTRASCAHAAPRQTSPRPPRCASRPRLARHR